ncbi:sugar phosphate isomerase/epimerase [Pseudovibrio sp. Ad37]|uniref:sugar phosphate isomerase/epimerase family protein n=1 Tax=Pseudovibrio sp. Ad37 TaxID=989422 RepID=UPI0007AE6125|nr:sugar phosphate isomerase/epimerase [Pseudovibrio sp. Ad37]KZL17082.1 Inosose dehydratase [Pseudovibrio sp. Ad37]
MDFSLQLYSARNTQPLTEVLSSLAKMGYTQVEGFGGVYEDPTALRQMLDANGLSMPSGHFGIDELEVDTAGYIELAKYLGITRIFAPFLTPSERPQTEAGWISFAHRLAQIGTKVQAAGLSFGWHNHDFEFQCEYDGRTAMEIILTEAPEIDWEADIAWIIRGGHDPITWVERFGSRITAVHVKDIAATGECADEDGWADVGFGTVQWRQILSVLQEKSSACVYVMEHDNPSDFARFAQRSLNSLKMLEGV